MKRSTPRPATASLLASGTEIICALGLADHLIAISHECDFPPEVLHLPRLSRPRFDPAGLDSGQVDRAVREAMAEYGSVYVIDEARLAELEPDLLLTQAVCEVCAVPTPGVRELVARRNLDANVLSLDAHTIEEILGTVLQVGAALGAEPRANQVVTAMRLRLAAVKRQVASAPKPRVLAIEWLNPPFAPGHWVPEMIELAGGINLVGQAGGHSREVPWSDLEALDPDVLIVMPCGYGLEGTLKDAEQHRAELTRVGARAMQQGRAFLVDGSSYFNRSGPRVVTGVEILAGLLHPGLAPAPAPGASAMWR